MTKTFLNPAETALSATPRITPRNTSDEKAHRAGQPHVLDFSMRIARHREREDGIDNDVADPLRDLPRHVTRDQVVLAERHVRPVLLDAAREDERGGLSGRHAPRESPARSARR